MIDSLPKWVLTNVVYKALLKKGSQSFDPEWDDKREPSGFDEGNLISSRACGKGEDAVHYPLLDLDINAKLVPSTTPGHFHLYIQKQLTTEEYKKLINVLAEVGIIQVGIKKQFYKHGETTLRLPWIKKEY